jgi:membrane protease YdiL (CAAX protease family)
MPIQSLPLIPSKVWLMLAAGPVLFLLGIVGASVFLSVREVPETQIPERVAALVPHILLFVLVCLAFLMTTLAPQVKAAWQLPAFTKAVSDVIVGLFAGVFLAVAYIYWLAPLLETLQRTAGDFVPPGAVLPTVSSSIGVFFIANVLLAPLVEETLYRGVAIPLFTTHLGPLGAVALTCVLFGLLHWAGGFWYMLLTGVVAGGLFSGLFLWRDGILAPFAAHFALNLVEFIYAWRVH